MNKRSKHLKEARKWLYYIRNGHGQCRTSIKHFYQELHDGDLTIEDLGVESSEITELRTRGCLSRALDFLNLLRKGTVQYEDFIQNMKQELDEGGFTLERIGSSEDEIKLLRKKGEKLALLN